VRGTITRRVQKFAASVKFTDRFCQVHYLKSFELFQSAPDPGFYAPGFVRPFRPVHGPDSDIIRQPDNRIRISDKRIFCHLKIAYDPIYWGKNNSF
jgi:hypothetical protein